MIVTHKINKGNAIPIQNLCLIKLLLHGTLRNLSTKALSTHKIMQIIETLSQEPRDYTVWKMTESRTNDNKNL